MDAKHKIPLRQYYKKIDDLILNQSHEEAVSLGKFLLEKYPKNIAVYQLLGKAYLDSQEFNAALTLFEKILEVKPDDFVSHIGVSLISESFGNVDQALSSMQRAYELHPSNESLQKEVQRLYETKDGFFPEKLRLTRGALIKMYSRSKLAEQAIAEARLGIHEFPDRIDFKVQLAEMFFLAGKPAEAIEQSMEILQTHPYCKPILEVLYKAFSESGNSEDASLYKSRLSELDPYFTFMKPETNLVNDIPDIAIMIEDNPLKESSISDIAEFLEKTWNSENSTDNTTPSTQSTDWESIVDDAIENDGIGAPITDTDLEEVNLDQTLPHEEEIVKENTLSPREKFLNRLSKTNNTSEEMVDDIPDWILLHREDQTDLTDSEEISAESEDYSMEPSFEHTMEQTSDFEEDGMTDHLVPVNPVIENEEFMISTQEWERERQALELSNRQSVNQKLDDTQRIKVIKKNPEEIINQLSTALSEMDMEFGSRCLESLISKSYKLDEIAKTIETFLAGNPKEIEFWLKLVRIYRELDEKDKALAALEQAQINISL